MHNSSNTDVDRRGIYVQVQNLLYANIHPLLLGRTIYEQQMLLNLFKNVHISFWHKLGKFPRESLA